MHDIATKLGNISYHAVSKTLKKAQNEISNNNAFKQKIAEITSALNKKAQL